MTRPVILTVDDDAQVLSAIAGDLRRKFGKDYRIVRASDAAEALAALRQLKDAAEPVALLLSDQRMPGLDGVGFLTEARTLFPNAKRALLTAYADTDAAIAAINQSQVDYYLQKPWDPPDQKLYPFVEELLDDWRSTYRPGYGGAKVIGSRFMPAAHQLKDFLARNHVPYEFFDVEATDDRGEEARALAAGVELPLVILPEGERLQAPSVADLARKVGLHVEATGTIYDVAIVGAGPAGLAAAVYAASEGLKTILLDREGPGGQAGLLEPYRELPRLSCWRIRRRPGAPRADTGPPLRSGSSVAGRGDRRAAGGAVQVPDGARHRWRAARDRLQGAGADARTRLAAAAGRVRRPVRGARRVLRLGDHEARNCRDQDVYVVGAANSAGQAAIFLAGFAKRVIMVVRGKSIDDKMSQYLVKRIEASDEQQEDRGAVRDRSRRVPRR